jgi:hypothetical protein
MGKGNEAVAAALTTLLRTVRDAEDLLAGLIDAEGDFTEPSVAAVRSLAAMMVRLKAAQADGHRALRERHVAMALEAMGENEEWGLSKGATP